MAVISASRLPMAHISCQMFCRRFIVQSTRVPVRRTPVTASTSVVVWIVSSEKNYRVPGRRWSNQYPLFYGLVADSCVQPSYVRNAQCEFRTSAMDDFILGSCPFEDGLNADQFRLLSCECSFFGILRIPWRMSRLCLNTF